MHNHKTSNSPKLNIGQDNKASYAGNKKAGIKTGSFILYRGKIYSKFNGY